MTKNTGKVVAVKPTQDVAIAAHREYDTNISNEDLILPRAELLQALSPSVISGGATAGSIVNNITKESLGSPTLIPIFLTKNWIRWRSREQGGGLLWRSSDPKDARVIQESNWGADGSKPLATAYLNFLCLHDGGDLPIIVSFANTNYKTGRKWLTLSRMSIGPLYSSQYLLSSQSQTNNKGTFFVFNVKKIGPATSEQIEKAKQLSQMFAGKDLNFESESESFKPSTEGIGDEF